MNIFIKKKTSKISLDNFLEINKNQKFKTEFKNK